MIEEITFCMKEHRTTVCRVTGGKENELGIRARFEEEELSYPSPLLCDFLFQVGVFAPSGVLVPLVAVRALTPFARVQN